MPELRVVVLSVLLGTAVGCGGDGGGAFDPGGAALAEVRFLEEAPDLGAPDGRWLFVNYWAEWCKPCLEEIPELNALNRDAGVVVVGINYDRLPAEEMRPQVARLGIEFPVAVGTAGSAFGISPPEVLPSTYVFAPDGEQVALLRGPQTLEQLREVMREES